MMNVTIINSLCLSKIIMAILTVRTYVRPCRCLKYVVKIPFEQNCSTSNISSETVGVEIEQKQPGNQTVKSENEAVINLSTIILSDSETKLFTKGLQFVPTRRNIDLGRLLTDLKEWERRMRLKEYFYNEEMNDFNEKDIKFKKQSTWTSDKGRDKWLETYIEEVKDDLLNGLHRNFKMNITPSEEKAMKDLLNDPTIIIRPADKCSGIVILDVNSYAENLKQEIHDNSTYK